MPKPNEPQMSEPPSLLPMITGSFTSQAISVAARLGIADLVCDGPKSNAELAQATGTHEPSLHRLMRALGGVGLFREIEAGRFALTPLGSPLRAGVPGSMRAAAMMFGGASRRVRRSASASSREPVREAGRSAGVTCMGAAAHAEQVATAVE